MVRHFENSSLPEAAKLIKDDEITFSVLMKILEEPCAHIFTDMEHLIVCHSCHPFPVWVWCDDTEKEQTLAQIARCIREQLPMEQGYHFNMSYELLEKLRETDPYFRDAGEKMGLLSYRLDEIEPIGQPCEGYMSPVCEEEIESLLDAWHDMHMEMEGHDFNPDHCRSTMSRKVAEKSLFAWHTGDGTIAALTGRGDQGQYGKITSVYTLPQFRRRGYALNLVHGVTETILADGLIPILYTDAGYAASNTCYQKIGYRQLGRLISICK